MIHSFMRLVKMMRIQTMNVVDVFDEFIQDKQAYCSKKTLIKYTSDFMNFNLFIQNTYFTESFKELQDKKILRDYILFLRKNGVRNVSIRSYCRSIKTFLRYSYENDYCVDYIKGVQLPKDDSKIKVVLFANEVAACDKVLSGNSEMQLRNWCIFHLMLDCGMRRQEVVNLQISDIIFEKNIIQIINSKGEKSRLVLCPEFVLVSLRIYLSISSSGRNYCFRTLRSNRQITDDTVKDLFQTLKVLTGIKRLHAHLLRHTFATSYLIGGGNLEFLRVFLGHYDYSCTKTYSSMAAQLKMLGADVYHLDPIFFERGY